MIESLTFTDEFIRKCRLSHYPMTGFWIQLGYTGSNDIYTSWKTGASDVYTTNTFIYPDNTVRVSIKIPDELTAANVWDTIYLYALDGFKYSDITDFNGPKDDMMFNQLSGLIRFTKDYIPFRYIAILEFKIPDLNKSFTPISIDGYPQVEHYNSSYIGKSNWFDSDLVTNQFIDKASGLNAMKENLTFHSPDKLLGSMTIRKSGIIQL